MRLPKTLLVLIGTVVSGTVFAQIDSLELPARRSAEHTAELIGLGASGDRTPFWLRANQYGIVPSGGSAGLLRIGTVGQLRSANRHPNRQLTHGVEAVAAVGQQVSVVLPQAYVSLDRGRFSLWVGRRREVIGLGDSTLTSGFYSWSGNALPVTKVQIGTNGFAPLRFTNDIVSVHAFFAHGWFTNSDSIRGSYLHQKALYVRIGRPDWCIRLTGGVLHNAQWGGRSDFVPTFWAKDGKMPDSIKDYLYVLTAREGGTSNSPNLTEFDRVNRVGNHLGSIDFGVDADVGRWQAMGYYQHPFEDKSGVAFINFPDGLYGLRVRRPSGTGSGFRVDHVLLEHLNTMSQSGSQTHTGSRYDGKDDYFNNYQYLDGWAQNRSVIGTPFLSRRADIRPDLPYGPEKRIWAIANNQVELYHLALAGTVGRQRVRQAVASPRWNTPMQYVRWQVKLSASRNYGAPRLAFRQSVAQFSGVASATWPLNWLGGSELQTAVALDNGQLYRNAVGGWLSLRKTWKSNV